MNILNFENYKKIAKQTNLIKKEILLPFFLSFASRIFEGISLILLAPLGRGAMDRDFSFVRENNFANILLKHIPQFQTNLEIFILILFLMITSFIIHICLKYLSDTLIGKQTLKFSNGLRKRIFSKYLKFGKEFFDKNDYGGLSNTLLEHTYIINEKILAMHKSFFEIFATIVYLTIMLIISWKLTLFTLITFPPIHFIIKAITKKIKENSRRGIHMQRILRKKVFNSLTNIPLIKTYSMEKNEKNEFNKITEIADKIEYDILKGYRLIEPVQEIVFLIEISIIIIAMAYLISIEGPSKIASYVLFFVLLRKMVSSATAYGRLNGIFAQISDRIKNILELFDKQSPIVSEGEKEFQELKEKISFKNLNFSYNKSKKVLDGITIQIEKGKMTAIVGPSGSGKTTLASLILRFYECEKNKLFFDNVPVEKFTLKSLYKKMAYVSQDTLLFNDTLEKNLTFGMQNISKKEIDKALKDARLNHLVDKLPNGIKTIIGDKGVKLSGGEKQRLSIARAILKKAQILILDEATSALDTKTEKQIQEAIKEITKQKTSIVIAHRLSTIKDSDKIIVLEDGKIKEEGTLKELLRKKGKFYNYWNEQKFD